MILQCFDNLCVCCYNLLMVLLSKWNNNCILCHVWDRLYCELKIINHNYYNSMVIIPSSQHWSKGSSEKAWKRYKTKSKTQICHVQSIYKDPFKFRFFFIDSTHLERPASSSGRGSLLGIIQEGAIQNLVYGNKLLQYWTLW